MKKVAFAPVKIPLDLMGQELVGLVGLVELVGLIAFIGFVELLGFIGFVELLGLVGLVELLSFVESRRSRMRWVFFSTRNL